MRRLIIEEPYSSAAIWSRRLAIFALAVAATSVALARAGADPAGALAVLGSSLVLGCLAALLAATAATVIWRTGRRGAGLAFAGFALAALLLAYPGFLAWRAIELPLLNDVSTDIETPPTFMRSSRALEARGGHTPADPGETVRQAVREAYPGLQPVLLDMEPMAAYQFTLAAVKARGWRIVDSIPPSVREAVGHIDAEDRSLVMGFVDDIAIRIKPLATQTRVDFRSVSRVGRHDFGDNARRIEKFAAELREDAQDK